MLRLFLTASRERRLVLGAKLGMLRLNSSGSTYRTHSPTASAAGTLKAVVKMEINIFYCQNIIIVSMFFFLLKWNVSELEIAQLCLTTANLHSWRI